MTLIEIQPLIDIITLSLQSIYINNEKNGISLILISAPETAKTSSIFQFINLNFVSYYDEITQKKLIDDFLPLLKTKQKRTLLIPDLINCIDKQKSTRNQFLSIIKTGTDDTGITRIETYHKHFSVEEYENIEGLKFNLITAITGTSFNIIKRKLAEIGLLSRFLPFTYNYPLNKISKIFNMLETETKENSITVRPIIKKDTDISIIPEHLKQFEIFATKLGEQYGGYGIRALIMFRRLLKASALLNNRTITTEEDVDFVMNLTRWMNFSFNPI